ncbi:MAG: hypothetical protein J5699_04990 [Bacteroidales bacterium]|nr:hypothetical protein [Bacteroidales bacterium]
MAEISSNKTIARNTLLLYLRMALTMIVSLYTSRVILSVLGIVDDGIYNIVGGAVGMFMFLNGALSGATSRFLTFELGRDDKERLKKTFSAALMVHILLAIFIFILLETVGLWLLNNKLVIPEERMHAARVVYQLSAFATLLSITQVPYSAAIIAHEKMGTFAYMSILEVVLKLLICYLIIISPIDKLISYGILVLCVKTLIVMIYRVYCIRKFEECHFSIVKDWGLIKPILTFSGWDLMGSFSSMARDQGVDVVLNMFFGPAINSAAGKAGIICNAVNGFSSNFLTAIKPPIVKAYAIGDIGKMESLMIDASKYAYSLLMLLSLPFFFESQFVIDLWLKNPPEYSALFCAVDLGLGLLIAIFLPLVYAIHASGNIRFMSLVNGSIWITVVPITYILLLAGKSPIVPYVVKYFLLFFVVISNLYSVKKNIPEFDRPLYLKKTILPAIISASISMAVTALVFFRFDGPSWWRFLAVCATSTLSICITVFFIVFDRHMRETLISKVKQYISRKNG